MLETYEKILTGITAVVKWVMLFFASVIFVVICFTVFTRYLLNYVASWSEEIPRYMLVWITYLGAGLAVNYKEHISLDVFFSLMPARARQVGHLILNGMVGIVGAIMVVYGIGLVRSFGDDLMESIPLTNFWLYLAMPISGTLIILYIIRDQWRRLRNFGKTEEESASDMVPI
jgi:TRAP-type C4-dicarboxylate transport system permease small subunit